MAVNSQHPEYTKNFKNWQLMRDVLGANVANEKYVPHLSDQDAKEYEAYVTRAEFFNATGRTKEALTGLIFAKPPKFELPTAITEICKNITLDDDELEAFNAKIADEILSVGRAGVLVDMPEVEKSGYTIKEAQNLNIRAYATLYKAENIINWRIIKINGRNVTSLVVLAESYTESGTDEFTEQIKTRYRVLDLHGGYYRQRIFIGGANNGAFSVQSEIYPTVSGAKFNYIPFTFFNVRDLRTDIDTPPLISLAKVNISHFKSEVDLEHGAHFTALPTPYVTGYQGETNEKLKIGSTVVWALRDPQSKVGFLEFSGAGLGTLETRIAVKEKRMAILGARMLLDEKKTAEATETVELRSTGERAILTTIANTLSAGIVSFLNDIAKFEGIDSSNFSYELNTNFNLSNVDPQLLEKLIAGIQGGLIPVEVLYNALFKGELIPESIENFEDYQAKLDQAAPSVEINEAI